MATIIFNGKSYNSLEEMPEKERLAYEQMMGIFADKNGNGIPDFMEGDLVQKVMAVNSTHVNINANGQTYQNLDDLPPELRQRVDKAFQVMTNFGIIPGVPEELKMNNQQGNREPMAQSKPLLFRVNTPPPFRRKAGRVFFRGSLAALCLCCVWQWRLLACFITLQDDPCSYLHPDRWRHRRCHCADPGHISAVDRAGTLHACPSRQNEWIQTGHEGNRLYGGSYLWALHPVTRCGPRIADLRPGHWLGRGSGCSCDLRFLFGDACKFVFQKVGIVSLPTVNLLFKPN